MLKTITALVVLFILATAPGVHAQSSSVSRAYFKIKNEKGLGLLVGKIRHDFGDGIFSIEAPQRVIDLLSKNSLLEFRGSASLWEISSHWNTAASCSPSTATPWGISKVNGGSGGAGVTVAVIDTGVNTTHPDLKANIAGCVDVQSSRIRSRCSDGNGHGSHVAGTIAANGKIKGVATEAKIFAIKACSDRGSCWSDDVARGIRYAADRGVQVINLSLGGSSLAQDERNALDDAIGKGVLVVAASGNSGPKVNSILYPAAYAPVISVGAMDSADNIANFSSRGNNYATTAYSLQERDLELVGPGVSVESTSRTGCYATYSGTSMATPHVAGLAAKLWQGNPLSTRTYLQDRARNNYADLGLAGDDPDAGFGLPTAP